MLNTPIESIVRVAAVTGIGNEYGTGFLISGSHIVTANHVILPEDIRPSQIKQITIVTDNGIMQEGKLVENCKAFDLAVIELEDELNHQVISKSVHIPTIGTECMWGGYPQLIGESTRHIRFGWGRVCSNPYGKKSSFFEIDGNFSPAHSGSPIFNCHTDELIGVVGRSAGDPRLHFEKYKRYLDALQFLIPYLDLPTKLLEAFSDLLYQLESNHSVSIPNDSPSFLAEGQESEDSDEIPNEIVRTLAEIGVEIWKMSHVNLGFVFGSDISKPPESIDTIQIRGYQTMFEGTLELFLRISKSIEEAVDQTFQMGIGVASGGEPLKELIAEFQ